MRDYRYDLWHPHAAPTAASRPFHITPCLAALDHGRHAGAEAAVEALCAGISAPATAMIAAIAIGGMAAAAGAGLGVAAAATIDAATAATVAAAAAAAAATASQRCM